MAEDAPQTRHRAEIHKRERPGTPLPDSRPEVAALCDVLLDALKTIAARGPADADLACQLAGKACATLRLQDERQWQRFNVFLHRMINKTGPVGGTPQP